MSKFNVTNTRSAVSSPVKSEAVPSVHTHEGGPGYLRDAKSELFLLAVSNMVGENTFYEKAADRDNRYVQLVHTVATTDPQWLSGFLPWLRDTANMRSASLVGALEAAHAMVAAGQPGARQIVAAVLQRADEPGEALAYWTSRYGRAISKPVKRGVADAVGRLYNEFSLLKYDTASHGFRFADVIDLVHPAPTAPWQGALFAHALDRRHDRDIDTFGDLTMVAANAQLRSDANVHPERLLDTGRLKAAGMTWEDVLSLAGSKVDKRQLWEALIPTLGYMAAIRNLRNMDEAGVSDAVATQLAARLADPEQVAKSRQLPFRFYSAYLTAPSLRWGHALDRALSAATANIPAFPGRTLVLVDTSASMTWGRLSARSTVSLVQAAALFGVSLAARGNDVDLMGFADWAFTHPVGKGASVLREVNKFVNRTGEAGHGTRIAMSLRTTYAGHDRVIIISDMQTFQDYEGTVTDAVPAHIPMYGFNLGGYQAAAMPTGLGTRHEIGGLSDATFKMIPLMESAGRADWPWVTAA
jgi:hypothetical protein